MLWTNVSRNQKIFFRYVNSKMKIRKGINRFKVNSQMCENPVEMVEIRVFHSVFTEERTFVGQSEMSKEMGQEEVQVTEEDVQKQLEGLDVKQVPGTDGVLGWY